MGLIDRLVDATVAGAKSDYGALNRVGGAIRQKLTPGATGAASPQPLRGTNQSVGDYFKGELAAFDPRTKPGLANLAAILLPGHRPVLSPYARSSQRVFRTIDLLPGLAFQHSGGSTGQLAREIEHGQGLHTPIEIDWDPRHGVGSVIQGNHRLLAAQETGLPFIPATLGPLYGDLARYLAYARSSPSKPAHHVYGQIQTGRASDELIAKLLRLSENSGHPETGGFYQYRKEPPLAPEEWDSLISALGLKNVRVEPGTTIDQVRAMPPFNTRKPVSQVSPAERKKVQGDLKDLLGKAGAKGTAKQRGLRG